MLIELTRFQRWVEGLAEELYVVDAMSRIRWANPAALASLGYTFDELTSTTMTALAPSIASGFPERFQRTVEGTLPPFSTAHVAKDGTVIPKEVRTFLLETNAEPLICAFVRDLRPHKVIEAELRQLTRLHTVLSRVTTAMQRVGDEHSVFQTVCDVATAEGGFRMAWVGLVEDRRVVPVAKAGLIEGYLDGLVVTLDDETSQGPTGKAISTGRIDVCEDVANTPRMAPWRNQALSRGYLASAAVPLRRGPRVVGALNLYAVTPGFFTARECELLEQIGEAISFALGHLQTERERTELAALLAQSSRLEAVGRLAGGVGHDFNNMLCVIISGTEEALHALPPGSPARDDLMLVLDAAQRSAKLTQKLLQVGRRQPVAPQPLSLNDAITRALPVLRRLAGEASTVGFEPQDVPAVLLDPTHLDQVLSNLVTNARDAAHGRARLHLSTRRERGPLAGWMASSSPVVLEVRDEGPGMPPEVLERIFEPFFTTKDSGKGTGLGLATVYALVQQAGGLITARSSPGEGTTITVALPAAG